MKYGYLILGSVLMLSSCTRRITIPVEQVRVQTDTVCELRVRSDTVIWRDSVVIVDKGDTIRHEVWHTRERVKWRDADKVHISHDTVIREVPVVVDSVDKNKPGRRDSFGARLKKLAEGVCGILAIIGIAGIALTYKYIKKR